MNNLLKSAVFGLALASANTFAADCAAPETPALPDGASASMEDMLAGQKAVKAFQASNLEYMTCVEGMIKAAQAKAQGEGATDEAVAAVKALEEQYNAAVSQEEGVAGDFNSAIRAYKEANPG